MSQHQKTDFPNFTKSQMDQGLILHHLPHDKPSQLADSFRAGAAWGSENYKNRRAATSPEIVQDWSNGQTRHRLRNTKTGDTTEWAPYNDWTYLDGMVGYTAYFFSKEGVMPAAEFSERLAIKKAKA